MSSRLVLSGSAYICFQPNAISSKLNNHENSHNYPLSTHPFANCQANCRERINGQHYQLIGHSRFRVSYLFIQTFRPHANSCACQICSPSAYYLVCVQILYLNTYTCSLLEQKAEAARLQQPIELSRKNAYLWYDVVCPCYYRFSLCVYCVAKCLEVSLFGVMGWRDIRPIIHDKRHGALKISSQSMA